MPRGRKKDLTIPPTRALTQQRDYRARKASYITELEFRCRRAEEENTRLRKELAAARAGLAIPALSLNPAEMVEASRELLDNLLLTSASLSKFQQLAFTEPTIPITRQAQTQPPGLVGNNFQPATFSRPQHTVVNPQESSGGIIWNGPEAIRTGSKDPEMVYSTPSASDDSECCAGLFSCRDFVENNGDDTARDAGGMTRMSGLRSTSNRS